MMSKLQMKSYAWIEKTYMSSLELHRSTELNECLKKKNRKVIFVDYLEYINLFTAFSTKSLNKNYEFS